MTVPTRAADAEAYRQALEDELNDIVYAAVSRFLVEVERLALSAEEVTSPLPTLTASPAHWAARALASWRIGSVHDAWDRLVVQPLARTLLERIPTATLGALLADETPALAGGAAEWVLWSAAGEEWTRRQAATTLSTVLSIDPAVRQAADVRTLAWIEEHTASWDARSRWIARTTATRASAESSLADAAASGFRFKRWCSRQDDRVRTEHHATDGQVVPLEQPFNVGGYPMGYPGDPDAPAFLTANCRCSLAFE